MRLSRRWADRRYRNIVHWNELDKGGHFAAWEQSELFVAELRAAFALMTLCSERRHHHPTASARAERGGVPRHLIAVARAPGAGILLIDTAAIRRCRSEHARLVPVASDDRAVAHIIDLNS